MVVLDMPLLVDLGFATGTDGGARALAEGLFGGETYEEDFCFFLLLLLVALVALLVMLVVFTRGKRIILSFFFLRIGRGGGIMVVMGIEVEVILAPSVLPVLRAIFSDMWTCRTASLMML